MKKILFGALAAATLVAFVGTASAQQLRERDWFDISAVQIQSPDGGASYGYNLRLQQGSEQLRRDQVIAIDVIRDRCDP